MLKSIIRWWRGIEPACVEIPSLSLTESDKPEYYNTSFFGEVTHIKTEFVGVYSYMFFKSNMGYLLKVKELNVTYY